MNRNFLNARVVAAIWLIFVLRGAFYCNLIPPVGGFRRMGTPSSNSVACTPAFCPTIWTGAWSFLTLRSWMYRVFELIFAVAAMMVVYSIARRPFWTI